MLISPTIAESLIWRPILPLLQIAVLAIALCTIAGFAYVRTFKSHPVASVLLLLMRLLTIATCTVLLVGPSYLPDAMQSDKKAELTVMLDISESMLTADCKGESRIKRAQQMWLNRPFLDRLSAECDIRLLGFAEEVRSLSIAEATDATRDLAVGRSTRLTESVNRSLASTRMGNEDSAMLVISDGHDTEDASIRPAASLARTKQIPIHTVALGGSTVQQDVTLLAVPMQEYLLPGEPGGLLVKVYQFGMPDEATTVRLRQGGRERKFPISFNHRNVVEMQIEIQHDEEGQFEYEVSVDALTDEHQSDNNQQTVFCEVQRRRMKVLLLEGQPYWDTKFLAQSLRKDERIELTQITQVSDDNRETIVTRVEEQAAQLPTTLDGWSEFDVVLVGRGLHYLLDSAGAALLRDYVNAGGNLVFARGRCYDPNDSEGRDMESILRSLEPVRWEDRILTKLQLALTPTGRTSTWLAENKMGLDSTDAFRELHGFETMRDNLGTKPATLVLAEAYDSEGSYPALTTMQFGRGKVVTFLGEGSWRWSLLGPEQQELALFYDVFWSNLVRWLVVGGDFRPGEQVSLRVSRQSARLGDGLTVDVIFKQPSAATGSWRLELTSPDGSLNTIQANRLPGKTPRFRETLQPTQTGVHELTLHTPGSSPQTQQRRFNVYDVNVERLETSARPAPLQVLSEHSGGTFLSWDRPDDLLDLLRRRRLATSVPPEAKYLWDQMALMVLLLAWMGCEWIFRRLAGML